MEENKISIEYWREQLAREDISKERRMYALGELRHETKTRGGSQRKETPKLWETIEEKKERERKIRTTISTLANEYNVTPSHINWCESYAIGIDLAEKTRPGIREKILSGKIKTRKYDLYCVQRVPEDRLYEFVSLIEKMEMDKLLELRHQFMWDNNASKKRRRDEYREKDECALKKRAQDAAEEHRLTFDGLVEDVGLIIKNMTGQIERSIKIRKDCLTEESARESVTLMLEGAIKKIESIMEELK